VLERFDQKVVARYSQCVKNEGVVPKGGWERSRRAEKQINNTSQA
jgi:hypothetical protein